MNEEPTLDEIIRKIREQKIEIGYLNEDDNDVDILKLRLYLTDVCYGEELWKHFQLNNHSKTEIIREVAKYIIQELDMSQANYGDKIAEKFLEYVTLSEEEDRSVTIKLLGILFEASLIAIDLDKY